jgi:hypothetical protein
MANVYIPWLEIYRGCYGMRLWKEVLVVKLLNIPKQ